MDNALLLRLQLLKTRLSNAITNTTMICEKAEKGVTKQEIVQVINTLKTSTSSISREVHLYMEKCTNIIEDEITECTQLQMRGEEQISVLTALLTTVDQCSDTLQQTKLPKLSLPKFDGNILSFHDFWDQFEAGIDSKPLPEVDKLSYLLASLESKAKEAVEGIGISKNNYQIVVEILKNRFGHKQTLVDSHYEELQMIKMATPTASECRKVLNSIEKNLRILQSLGENINNNQLRVTILSKFPEKIIYELNKTLRGSNAVSSIRHELDNIITAMEFSQKVLLPETSSCSNNVPATTDALFVREHRKPIRHGLPGRSNKKGQKRKLPNMFRKNDNDNGKKWRRKGCVFCEGPHYNDTCLKFSNILERKKKLGSKCLICFKPGHYAKECIVNMICYHCQGRHNRALCPKKYEQSKYPSVYNMWNNNNCFMYNQGSFLQTAVVTMKTQKGDRKTRLLLDSGSQRSYITLRLANDLKLKVNKEDELMIFSFGSEKPTQTSSPSVDIEFVTRRGHIRRIQANVVPHITERVSVPKLNKEFCVDVLADDGSAGEKVDVLIGNDYYFSFYKSESKKLDENLFLINTEFGWIISGKVDCDNQNVLSIITYCQCHGPECMYYTEPDLPLRNMDLTFLWSFESVGIVDNPKATREEEAVKHFNSTVQFSDNRYMIKWPWIEYPPQIPTNFGLAYGRLKGLIQRIEESTLEEYQLILREQLECGIIEIIEVNDDVTIQRSPPIHYIPHHIIKQEGKRGRVVYDASGKLKDQKSLNECMYRGPSLIGDLIAMLIQFRTYEIAITADVEKAFLQIGLQSEDRDVTRFLWLKDVNQPISEKNLLHLRFCRVPFGIISSPFILTATIYYHISQKYPKLLTKIADKFYVDNLVTGSRSVEEAQHLYEETIKVFQDLSMNIRDWNSNNTNFLNSIPKHLRAESSSETKMLGLVWNPTKDTLRLNIKHNLLSKLNIKNIQTKREVLSLIASLYDPCGFCSPLILPAKLLLQEMWEQKIKWDTTLTEELQIKWNEVAECLRMVILVEIPRFASLVSKGHDLVYELHCFTDASKNAYAAVVYLRTYNGLEAKSSLLMAKSKIIPREEKENLKIPKLELLGYYIGGNLITYVKNVISLKIQNQYLWTDSMIVLSWMRSNKLLPPFVSRRVNSIKQNKDLHFCYINTENNPADIATRPESWIQKSDLWFQGPEFLLKNKREWPLNMYPGIHDSSASQEGLDSNYPDTVMLADNQVDRISDDELKESHNIKILKALQKQHFPNEVDGKETHLARNLKLYLDVDGILRCRGRMANTNWSYDMKHPALIPRDSEFTNKLIKQIHHDNYHVGVSHTLSLIREKFWIPQGRAQVQKILKQCESCVKHGGGPYKLPPTSDLPSERVNYSPPFTYTGLDYFGPLYVTEGITKEKRWVCLYTCLAVRAVHMEVVKDLTADECLLAMRRFVSVRGKPEMVVSDNATLFKLSSAIVTNQIKWKFIPQLAPWHGGFYERLVGLVKHCMKRTLEKHLLKDSQLITVVKEIEAVLNSRPLTPVGLEPDHILKPVDFLNLGKCIPIEPPQDSVLPGSTITKQTLIEAWKRGRKVIEEFKSMFINQYLYCLRERYDNSPKQPRITHKQTPKIGALVQIKGDTKNRNNWKVGNIISLIPGADGEFRVAKIKVGETEFTRSVGHLYPLEVEQEVLESEKDSLETVESEIAVVEKENSFADHHIREIQENSTEPFLREREKVASPKDDNSIHVEVEEIPNIEIGQKLTEQMGEDDQQEVLDVQDDPLPDRPKRRAAIIARQRMAELTRSLLTRL